LKLARPNWRRPQVWHYQQSGAWIENVLKVQQALEDAGVIFIDEDEEGPGVRLRKSGGD
jgi:hypothetical protein